MHTDLLIIGAGPAGMAAATEAVKLGLGTVLLDEQRQAGGQIYRHVEAGGLFDRSILGAEYYTGEAMVRALQQSTCLHITEACVWQITTDGKVFYSRHGEASVIQAQHVLIATGAQERPMPIAGWTLPGVMTAGAAQIMLKNSGLAASEAVFAGTGPLLYLVVWQYLQAGIKVKALLDTTPRANYYLAMGKWLSACYGVGYVRKGLALLRGIKSAGVPIIKEISELEAIAGGESGISTVKYVAKGQAGSIGTQHLFLHQGVVPNINLAMASGCQHHWHDQQLCWTPEVDQWGLSTQAHISIVGDAGGIGGAKASAWQGSMAVQNVACLLGHHTAHVRDQNSRKWRQKWQRERAFRPFIDQLYSPAPGFRMPQRDDVLVCRCEEVSLAEIKSAAAQRCLGPNQLKSFTRAGMGSCQGRQCGLSVSELMANYTDQTMDESGYYRLRAPIKPLTLGELATLDTRLL